MLFRHGSKPCTVLLAIGLTLVGAPPVVPAHAAPTDLPLPELRSSVTEEPPLPLRRPEDLLVPKDASTAYRRAFSLAADGSWSAVKELTRTPVRPELEKALTWLRLRDSKSGASFAETAMFISENPTWPDRNQLIALAEDRMPDDLPPEVMRDWFKTISPRTSTGRIKYLRSLEDTDDSGTLEKTVRDYWHNIPFTLSDHRAFLQRYRSLLRPDDNWIRLDHMLWRGYITAANRVLPLVQPDQRKLALARIKLRTQAPGVDSAINRVPQALQNDPGLVYERLRWRNRKGYKDSALDLLWSVSSEQQYPDLWWNERARQIRYALDEGRKEDAYLLSAAHVQEDGLTFAEAEWHAGWIALRYANKPVEALAAFSRLYRNVNTSISLGRAAYWAGRASESLGDDRQANAWYERAAANPATFYGQLANARLTSESFKLPNEPRPSVKESDAFNNTELVRVASALSRIGENDLARDFVLHLSRHAEDGDEAVLVARLARELGYIDIAVRTARYAARKGIMLADSGYPTRYSNERGPLEPALMLSIVRQESGFDPQAMSRAGARGLMQLMPATAQHVSKQVNQRYSVRRLTADPYFNLRLGSTYLANLIDKYGGNYILAVAAYNAGPGNVDSWLRERGDPREAKTDVIDWIERIPFPETRNYVQRVLEGLVVYRARLGRHSPVIAWDKVSPRDVWCVTACGVLLDAHAASLPKGG